MQFWIARDGSTAIGDAVFGGIDVSSVPLNVDMVFWNGAQGELLYNDRVTAREPFTDPTPYLPILNDWIRAASNLIPSTVRASPPLTVTQAQTIKRSLVDALFAVKRQAPVSYLGSSWDAGDADQAAMSQAINAVGPGSVPTITSGGLTLSNNIATPASVIDIAAGSTTDDTNVSVMTLAAPISKSLASNWLVGTGHGGLDTGAATTGKWYHVFLIQRSDTGVVDALFSLSPTTPTMPLGYDRKRWIFAVMYQTGPAIRPFIQIGDTCWWATPSLDVNDATLGAPRKSYVLLTPLGIVTEAIVNFSFVNAATVFIQLTSLFQPDQAPLTLGNIASGTAVAGVTQQIPNYRILTDTLSQVAARASSVSTTFQASVLGWRSVPSTAPIGPVAVVGSPVSWVPQSGAQQNLTFVQMTGLLKVATDRRATLQAALVTHKNAISALTTTAVVANYDITAGW